MLAEYGEYGEDMTWWRNMEKTWRSPGSLTTDSPIGISRAGFVTPYPIFRCRKQGESSSRPKI